MSPDNNKPVDELGPLRGAVEAIRSEAPPAGAETATRRVAHFSYVEETDLTALEEAASLVHAAFPPTPQHAWPLLRDRTGCEVWVKHENHTPAGAFKIRGGLVYMERLKRERPHVKGEADVAQAERRGLVGMSGHHGRGGGPRICDPR